MNVDKTNKLKGMIKDSFYGIDQLKKDYGLKTDAVWFTAFNAAPSTRYKLFKKDEKEWREVKRSTTNNFIYNTWCKGW